MVKYPVKISLTGKRFIWLTITGYSTLLGGKSRHQELEIASYIGFRSLKLRTMNSFMHASAQLSLAILYSQGSPAQEMIPLTITMCFHTLIDQDSLRHSQPYYGQSLRCVPWRPASFLSC